ncbi:hypothetical protein A2331_06260 [Candidatus Falkowbacteria bacterium RIFOXYB2_FULL_34_18]|uniref:Cation efflux protein transmembrane domain-containing protein n=1 Tax=Candidatus Falkowbacteria bacterium RIFOXYD2_FULL_34_120 TaxID=1798007 RepID=A0A1F5TNS6_9BACT|nr:MAG: hypothetical protein A2331_06260 [Candidatus Falkowbacteria bacterium RIFOXYB2_FULL_34_18]OGF28764.1 MAG: hypothetical protein A2500_04440 [Candidatus Falkowbacteria bacterium RIFOXYC12_FULL_34_55]OGF35708.1 MAG: hypothetical protein A2466_05120 [Candidatus Falkowbacteria bacterium RIFOXYC2_FULL_34_220]OGF38424.1 MAG: hypothetical protein A2515_00615 [Candidatus Falkowbacteria bacterium RIFOXYD12_FULL_34_57]OGF40478.1 MAG: hypothetical protein A2531_03090 [Candidatus Falkowbacteria bact
MIYKHNHECGHNHNIKDYSEIIRYKKALFWTGLVFVVQFFVAYISGSLTLLSDTFHVGSDFVATIGSLVVACIAISATKKREQKIRIIFAYTGILLLVFSGFYVLYEVWQRFLNPINIMVWPVIITAIAGALGNYRVFRLLHAVPTAECNSTHNVLSAHVFSDFLLSLVVIVSALLIFIFDWRQADLIVSFFVALYMLYLSGSLFLQVKRGQQHFH